MYQVSAQKIIDKIKICYNLQHILHTAQFCVQISE